MTEKCWKIEEQRPVIVVVEKSLSEKYYCVVVPELKMKYETWEKLGSNLSRKSIEHGRSIGRVYTENQHEEANDVSGSSYSYKTGKAYFTASTIEDVNTWLKANSKIIVKSN